MRRYRYVDSFVCGAVFLYLLFSLRTTGGCLSAPHPSDAVFRIAKNNAAKISPTLTPSLRHFFVEVFRSWVMLGHVTKPGQVTTPHKNFGNCVTTTMIK